MDKDPVVSVLCTAYQHEQFIGKALDSFIAQKTDFPFEVVVNDDASTDGTAEIIRSYANRFPHIVKPIYQEKNQYAAAPGKVLQIIIDAAKGKYLAFCEGDDYWVDDAKLQKQVDLLESYPNAGGCFHLTGQEFHGVTGTGRVFGQHEGQSRFRVEDTLSAYALCHTSSFLCRAEALVFNDWQLRIVNGDLALFSVVAAWGELLCINEVMSVYRKNEGGVTFDLEKDLISLHQKRIDLMDILDKYHGYAYSQKVKEVKHIHQLEIDRIKQQAKSHRTLRNLLERVLARLR